LQRLNRTIEETIEGDVRPVLKNAEAAAKGFPETMGRLNTTLDRVDTIVKGQEAKIDATLTNIQAITSNLQKVDNLPESVAHFNRTLGQFDALIVSEQDGIGDIVQNLKEASQNLNELTEWAKKNPSGALFSEPPPQDGGQP
jgi:paraquat-inducible protein B